MSVSNNHILEISMIKELINNSSKNDETKHNLIEVLETIIKVLNVILKVLNSFALSSFSIIYGLR